MSEETDELVYEKIIDFARSKYEELNERFSEVAFDRSEMICVITEMQRKLSELLHDELEELSVELREILESALRECDLFDVSSYMCDLFEEELERCARDKDEIEQAKSLK